MTETPAASARESALLRVELEKFVGMVRTA